MRNIFVFGLVALVLAGAAYFAFKQTVVAPTNTLDGTSTPTTGATLDLSNQRLSKTPEYVFSRTDLEKLDLSHNMLTGALQSQIGNLKKLKVLDLSNNQFTGVPAEVGQLRDLEVLDLSDNQLTGLPNELGNLSKLQLLNLTGNAYSEADLAGIRARLPATTVIKTN